jgi:hypothetical protein
LQLLQRKEISIQFYTKFRCSFHNFHYFLWLLHLFVVSTALFLETTTLISLSFATSPLKSDEFVQMSNKESKKTKFIGLRIVAIILCSILIVCSSFYNIFLQEKQLFKHIFV